MVKSRDSFKGKSVSKGKDFHPIVFEQIKNPGTAKESLNQADDQTSQAASTPQSHRRQTKPKKTVSFLQTDQGQLIVSLAAITSKRAGYIKPIGDLICHSPTESEPRRHRFENLPDFDDSDSAESDGPCEGIHLSSGSSSDSGGDDSDQ